ncbi:MAG: flagellar basal body P-ring formation chaperone FlgA [Roseicyclus sp.]
MRAGLLALCLLAVVPIAQARAETLVAATTIRGSAVIGPEDLALQPVVTPGALTSPADAVGMEARVNLYPGRPIRAGDLQPPAVIGRNDIVTLQYTAGAILIVTEGRALDRAAEGERLRIQNLGSRATVTAVAIGPGLAEVGDLP